MNVLPRENQIAAIATRDGRRATVPESGGTPSERAAKESGLREIRTSRLSERANVGRKPRLSRRYTEEAGEQGRATGGSQSLFPDR